jgi:hypothetical protein
LGRTLLGDLDRAAGHADLVEHHVLRREGQRYAPAPDVAPIAGAIGFQIQSQDRIDDGDPAGLDGAAEQRGDIEPSLERARFEEGPVEASLLIGNLDVVESELGSRQQDEVNLPPTLTWRPSSLLAWVSNTGR